MPTIKRIKGGFQIKHTTREVWGVDDPTPAIKLELTSHPRSLETVYLVTVDGVKKGLVSQFKPEPGTTHPWKAFRMAVTRWSCVPNEMIGVFYGRHGKDQAINAVVYRD